MSVRTLVKSIQNIMRQDTGVDGDAQRISQLCWMFFLMIIDDQDQELVLMRDDYVSPIPEAYQWRTWVTDPEGITGDALMAFVNDDLFPALKNLSMTGQPGDRRRVVRDVFEDAHNYMKSGQMMRQVVNKINEVDFNDLSERQHFGDIYEQILNDLQSAGNAGEYYTPRAVTVFMADRIDPKPGETLFDPACGTGGFLTCSLRHMRERYVKRPEDSRSCRQRCAPLRRSSFPTCSASRFRKPLKPFSALQKSTSSQCAVLQRFSVTIRATNPVRLISIFELRKHFATGFQHNPGMPCPDFAAE